MANGTFHNMARSWLPGLLGLSALAGCVDSDPAADQTDAAGFGTAALGLGGDVAGVQAFRLRLFEGPVLSDKQQAKYVLATCAPFVGADGKPTSKLSLSVVPARSDYSVLVDLYSDAGCTSPKYRGYRGGIAIKAGQNLASTPYHVPVVELGAFTPLVGVAAELQDKARARACSSDGDCKTVHPNATCAKDNLCTVDSLFPLNSGQRRAFASSAVLDDGRVAFFGGVTVETGTAPDRYWSSIAGSADGQLVETYDPRRGIFAGQVVGTEGAALALTQTTALSGVSLAFAGGSSSLRAAFAGNVLQLGLDTRNCQTTSTACALSRAVQRWSLPTTGASALAQSATLDAPLALPIMHTVDTPAGQRLLVAGGANLPISAFDPRSGSAVLCAATDAGVDCSTKPKNSMQLGRANAATACLTTSATGGCSQVLILGGRRTAGVAPVAEVFDGTTESFSAVTVTGAPESLHGGQLLTLAPGRLLLVGASQKRVWLEDAELTTGGDLPPQLLQVTTGAGGVSIVMTAVAGVEPRLFPATSQLADNSVLIAGGLTPTLTAATTALWIGVDGALAGTFALGTPRFGASAGRIPGTGPTGGCILLSGGFGIAPAAGAGPATLTPLAAAEVFCPAVTGAQPTP
jgi:hypothetical protein